MKTAFMVAALCAAGWAAGAMAQADRPVEKASAAATQPEDQQNIVVRGHRRRWEPDRIVCKDLDQPGSRLNVVRVCRTMLQWATDLRDDQQMLLQKQYNGAP
jgi:hypothetical protein